MENYKKRARVKSFPEFIPNCIHVQSGGRVRNYVQAARDLLASRDNVVVFGQATGINKAVSVAEVLKRQNALDSSIEIFEREETDEWEPVDKQLDKIIVTKHVPCIKISLAKQSPVS